MLGKLLKYDLKSTARIFLPLYAVLLAFALINRFLDPFQINRMENGIEFQAAAAANSFNLQAILATFSIMAYFILIIAVFVMTLVITIQRFYRNLLGDEGYLMFTLPVNAWQHIVSKLLVAMMWYVLSFAAVACSAVVLVGTSVIRSGLPHLAEMIQKGFGNAGFAVLPIFILIELAASTLMIYDAMALGHLFPRHRLLASFGMYCVLYFIYELVLTIFLFAFGNTIFASILHSSVPTPHQLNLFFVLLALIAILTAAIHFIVINFILKRKLNLE